MCTLTLVDPCSPCPLLPQKVGLKLCARVTAGVVMGNGRGGAVRRVGAGTRTIGHWGLA